MSQLPVIDLGEDFNFIEEIRSCNISTNKNQDKLNDNEGKKQISLQTWSKGHIIGLKVKYFFMMFLKMILKMILKIYFMVILKIFTNFL